MRIPVWLLPLVLLPHIIQSQNAVTYLDERQWPGGRLGDMLIMYVKAKWVAFHHTIPLLYKPFTYSDQLAMHVNEEHFSASHMRYPHTITYNKAPKTFASNSLSSTNTLYVTHFYFHLAHWNHLPNAYRSQDIMEWPEIYNDAEFLNELKKNIAPRYPIALLQLPTDKLTVAVHVRAGGGYDKPLLSPQLYAINATSQAPIKQSNGINAPYADKGWPLRFPPLQYYVDQIQRISAMHHDQDIFLFIFTDSSDPATLMNTIATAVNKKNITFACRNNNNHHTRNVLEDMFSMAQFDCLIRSASHYPQISQLLGNHRVVIYPKSCHWMSNTLVIDHVGTFIRD